MLESHAGSDDIIPLERAEELARSPIVPEIVEPPLRYAEEDLRAMVAASGFRTTQDAIRDLVDGFRQIVARLTNPVVVQRYSSFHLVRDPLWRPRPAKPGAAAPGARRDILDEYIAWESFEGLLDPGGPYPELARLIAKARSNWLAAAAELLRRIAADEDELAARFGVPRGTLSPLSRAKCGVSDPHNDGRTVALLEFGPFKTVYKPRPLDAETAWNAIADSVFRGLGQECRLPWILARDGYGFMEFVEPADCPDDAAIERCYHRYGVLAGIAHAIGTCDLHHENVIVAGEHPVVIDAEPLFRVRLATSRKGDERLRVDQNLSLSTIDVRESVLELGILPTAMPSPLERQDQESEREDVEIGALCAFASAPFTETVPCALGSDNLQLRPCRIASGVFPNLPRVAGAPRLPAPHLEHILSGFETAHRHVQEHGKAMAEQDGLLGRHSSGIVRLLARPTMDYMTVLSRSLSPQALRSAEGRRGFVASDLRALARYRMDTVDALLPTEVESIMDGDIPFFALRSDHDRCEDAELHATPVESARSRLLALDDLDRTMQTVQIREQLVRRDRELLKSRPVELDPLAIKEHAFKIVEALVDTAVVIDGCPTWVYASYAPGVSSTMAHVDRESFYEGAAGTAVAIAEAARLAHRDDWMSVAVGVFGPAMRGEASRFQRRGSGMARGVGGMVYAMTRVAEAGDSQELLECALKTAIRYGSSALESDALDEILHGSAGLLLAVLALHRRLPDPRLLRIADAAASKLVRNATSREDDAFWSVPGAAPMSNASHGSSGIAMALARWADIRGDSCASRLASRALSHDDGFWIASEAGWEDSRFRHLELETRTNWSWCNGRSGALLARSSIARSLGTDFLSEQVAAALEAACSDVLSEASPGMCCGTSGVLDALTALRQALPAPHAPLEERISDAARQISLRTNAAHHSMLTGSLFTGTAGLAFGLMRAACPDEVASLLLFE